MLDRATFHRHRAWLTAAVFALAVLAYAPSLAGVYVFDDIHSVSDNPALQDLGNLGRFWIDPAAFSRGAGTMYRPFLVTSFALNLAVSAEAWSLKLGNLLLHGAVVALLFRWLAAFGRRLWPAAAAAALFAVHPLASEAVNLVSARSELLLAFGLLLGLLAHVHWQRGGSGALAWLGMLAGTVVACGSKETGVVLPALLLVQTFCLRVRTPGRADWRRAAIGLAGVIALVVVYLVARKLLMGAVAVPLLERAAGDPRIGAGRTLSVQLATMGTLLPTALRQCVWPWPLTLDPVVQFDRSFANLGVLAGWATMFVATVVAMGRGPAARLRRVGVVLAWAVALPWIVVPLNMPYAEHRMYAPLLGLTAVLAAGAPPLLAGLRRRVAALRTPAVRALFAAALLVAAIGSGARSWCYHDELALWQAELAQRDDSFAAWWGVGTVRLRRGEVADAVPALERAHALNPENCDAHRNLAEALLSLPDAQAQPERALAVALGVQRAMPKDPWVRTLVAQAHLQNGRCGRGREHFEQAEAVALSCLQIASPKGYVYQIAAMGRAGCGDMAGALAHLDTSIARGLAPVGVRLDRARVLQALGRAAEARAELRQAQMLAPFDPAVLAALQQAAAPPK
jgi:tetratricopeptide (TPR) repeat protein